MDKQEIFDKVWLGLKKQNWAKSEQFLGGGYHCRYRSDNGNCCAIGFLIPDDMYNKDMEGVSVPDSCFDPEVSSASIDSLLPSSKMLYTVLEKLDLLKHIVLLSDLQDLHDVYPQSLIKQEMIKLANRYGLIVPEIKEI